MPRAPSFWLDPRHPLGAALAPLGWAYGAAAGCRLARAPDYISHRPVVCIGNLVAGGQGKTPLALAVAQALRDQGRAPVFLSRGYGGTVSGPLQVSAHHTAREVGDEPLLLADVAPCVVASDRSAGARHAESLGDVIVMDDGFQNPSLAKTVSLLVADAGFGLGNGRMIPAGPLRAPLEAQLSRADALVVVGEGEPGAALRHAVAGRVPVLEGRLRPGASFADTRTIAFAGIGRPAKFFDSLARTGAEIVERRAFPDHHAYTSAEAQALLDLAARHGATLVTTAKDAARLKGAQGAAGRLAAEAGVLPVTLDVEGGLARWLAPTL